MHAFVIGLVDQLLDPALVVADVADRLEVLQETADHARHGGDGFQHHGAVAIAVGKELVGEEPHDFHGAKGDAVVDVAGFVMHRDQVIGPGREVLMFHR